MICRKFIAVYLKSQLILIYKKQRWILFIFMLYKTKKNFSSFTSESVPSLFMLTSTRWQEYRTRQHYRHDFQVLMYGMFTHCLCVMLTHITQAFFKFRSNNSLSMYSFHPRLKFSQQYHWRFKYSGMLCCIAR